MPHQYITVPADKLISVLKRIKPIVRKNETIPILQSVSIASNQNALCLCASNLDQEIEIDIHPLSKPHDTIIDTCVDLKSLLMAVTLMKGKLVHLYQDEQNLKISSGTDIFDFPVTCKSDELPIISDCLYSDTDPQFHIFSTELSQIFSRLIGCVSFEETRYYLNGVFMHEKNGKLCAVTTDGHRLRLYETDHDCPSGFRGILPFQFIIAAIEAIKTDNQIVTLRFYDQVKEGQSYGKAEMIAGGTRLRTKIIDGIYPDYQKVMPENIDEQIRVTSLDLKSAITKAKTASRCTDDNLKSIKLSTYDDNLCIRVNDGKPGFEYTQYIQCEGTLSKPLCADVNYISGLVKDAPGDTILLGIQQDDLSKYVIDAFSITSESDPVTSILMPVKASS